MNDQNALKPCPFCGATGEVCETHKGHFVVICGNEACGCRVMPEQSPLAAITVWNERSVPPGPVEQPVDQVSEREPCPNPDLEAVWHCRNCGHISRDDNVPTPATPQVSENTSCPVCHGAGRKEAKLGMCEYCGAVSEDSSSPAEKEHFCYPVLPNADDWEGASHGEERACSCGKIWKFDAGRAPGWRSSTSPAVEDVGEVEKSLPAAKGGQP